MNGKFRAGPRGLAVDERQGEAHAHRVAISPRSHISHPTVALPNRFIARGIGIGGIDFKRHQQCPGTFFALLQGRDATHEVQLVEGNEAVHAGHSRRIALTELGGPDAEALLQPHREQRIVTIFDDAQILTGIEQDLAQPSMLDRRTVDLVSQFTNHRETADMGAVQANVEFSTAEERQSLAGDVVTRQPLQQRV